jgi:aspartate racemase
MEVGMKRANGIRWIGIFALALAAALPFPACRTRPGVLPRAVLGIFGGMGPEATANLYQTIVAMTPADRDQDHIPTLIFSFPQVPDRTTAIRSGDRSIVPYLVEGVRLLERSGATLIAIPCNTAHYYYDDMQKAVRIPIIHMIREAADETLRLHPGVETVGLLATSGTIASGLYEKEFLARGVRTLVPDEASQSGLVMRSIGLIKANRDREVCRDLLGRAGRDLVARGARVVVLGCTEIPLAFDPATVDVPVVNASRVLAEAAMRVFWEQTGTPPALFIKRRP